MSIDIKIYVVGSSKNKFLQLDHIREKFLIDQKHEGDNIDFLNPWYCELTGLYYLWKNCNNDIIGLEHYRTYFWKNRHLLNKDDIEKLLAEHDVIAGNFIYPIFGSKTLYNELVRILGIKKVEIILNLIKEKDKSFFDYFFKYLNGQKFWCCNAFIGKKMILDNYCDYIFNFLVDLEKICKIGPATKTYRHEGFVAEFIFGAWLEYNCNVIRCDINKFSKTLNRTQFYMAGEKL